MPNSWVLPSNYSKHLAHNDHSKLYVQECEIHPSISWSHFCIGRRDTCYPDLRTWPFQAPSAYSTRNMSRRCERHHTNTRSNYTKPSTTSVHGVMEAGWAAPASGGSSMGGPLAAAPAPLLHSVQRPLRLGPARPRRACRCVKVLLRHLSHVV